MSERQDRDGGDWFFSDPRMPFVHWRRSRRNARSFAEHLHPFFSIGAVEQGIVTFRVAGIEHELIPGMLALINPETLHACNPAPGVLRNFSMLFLDVAWCLAVQQALWQVHAFVPVQKVVLNDREACLCFGRLLALLAEPHHLLDREQALTELAALVFERACRPEQPIAELDGEVESIKSGLAENLQDDISLSDLAGRLEVNPYTLLRRFRRATGLTPHRYRMQCRLELARQLLRRGQDIGEVALECGFFDQSHLHRYFVQATAVTPRQYQEGSLNP